MVGAHCLARIRPTSVLPVNDKCLTMSLEHSTLPISIELTASAVRIFSTPEGIPARIANSPSARAESGVASAGLITTGQPAAKAGATLRVIIAIGKFHGVIAAQTPTGCLITM